MEENKSPPEDRGGPSPHDLARGILALNDSIGFSDSVV